MHAIALLNFKVIWNFPAYDWTCDERMGGGILTLVGSHIIDLLSHLTGLKATRFVELRQY